MSGGADLDDQEKGGHQVVIFTFKGALSAKEVEEWNTQIAALKELFGDRVMGVTIGGKNSLRRGIKRRRRR